MKVESYGQIYSWSEVPVGTLFLCKSDRHRFFGMKVELSEQVACLLLQGKREEGPTFATLVSPADLLNESLMSLPNATIAFQGSLEAVELSRHVVAAPGELLLVDGTVNLCVRTSGGTNFFIDLEAGKLNANTNGRIRAIVPTWSIVLKTETGSELLLSFPETVTHQPSEGPPSERR
jgi:hypothetical protein